MIWKHLIFCLFLMTMLFFCQHSIASSNYNSLHAWSSIEYLYWFPQNSSIGVPLVTKNNNSSSLGTIGEPGTHIIFGSGSNKNSFQFNGISGGRVTLGAWLDKANFFGLEASGFNLSEVKNIFAASSVNDGTINIPFFNVKESSEDVVVDHHPNTVNISETFKPWGLELNSLYNIEDRIHFPVILMLGVMYFDLNENFTLNDAVYKIPTFPNSTINVRDKFSTKNNFYALQIGARSHWDWHKFNLNLTGLIALGDNVEKLIIKGQTNIDNQIILQPFGIFSEPSNIGTHTHNQFAVMPEIRAKLGYDMSKNIRTFLTYNCFYINNVIHPGEQIDRNINLSQNPAFGGSGLSGNPTPTAKFNNSGMWTQGIGAGIEVSI